MCSYHEDSAVVKTLKYKSTGLWFNLLLWMLSKEN